MLSRCVVEAFATCRFAAASRLPPAAWACRRAPVFMLTRVVVRPVIGRQIEATLISLTVSQWQARNSSAEGRSMP